MRIPFRQGLVKAGPTFLTISAGSVTLNTTDSPLVVTIAAGSKDYLWIEPQSVPNAWGPIGSQDTWLYIDINRRTAARTFNITTIAPVVASSAPAVQAGKHWYDTNTDEMKVWSGTAWQPRNRVFVAKLANGSVIQSMSINSPAFTGTQVGDTSESFAGQILFDLNDEPIKQTDGRFLTTEDRMRSRVLSTAELKVASMQLEAEASENLSKYTIVVFSDFGVIEHASLFSPSMMGQFGIIERDTLTGQIATVATSGVITNSEWDWTSVGINQPLYCTTSGTLSAIEQIPGQVPVAVIVDRYSIQLGTPQIKAAAAVAAIATSAQAGSVRLSVSAASGADPIAVGTNDPRMTNARTPTAHTHTASQITDLTTAITDAVGALAPADHDHVSADITDLSTTISTAVNAGVATRAPTVHTHTASQITDFNTAVAAQLPSLANYVTGPASVTADEIVRFNGTTGKIIKGGLTFTTSTTLAGNSNTAIPSEAAVKAYIDAKPSGDPDAVIGPASSVTDRFVTFNGTTGKLVKDSGLLLTTSTTLAGNADTNIPTEKAVKAYVDASVAGGGGGGSAGGGITSYDLGVAASDEVSPLTTGTNKITLRAPRAFTLTGVRASLTTAQTSGALLTVNVKVGGVSVFTTKITFDNGEKTSTTAAAAAVLTSSALSVADDAEITVDIDQIGDGTAKGLKLNLIGNTTGARSVSTVTALTNNAGVVNIDLLLGDYFTLTLAANVTSWTFSNLPGSGKGASVMVEITQGAGNYTVAWPSSFKFATGHSNSVSTASGAIDVLSLTTFNNGTLWRATLGKTFV